MLQRRRGLSMVIAGDQAQPIGKRLELLRPSLERAAEESLQLRLRARQTLLFFATVLSERRSATRGRPRHALISLPGPAKTRQNSPSCSLSRNLG